MKIYLKTVFDPTAKNYPYKAYAYKIFLFFRKWKYLGVASGNTKKEAKENAFEMIKNPNKITHEYYDI